MAEQVVGVVKTLDPVKRTGFMKIVGPVPGGKVLRDPLIGGYG